MQNNWLASAPMGSQNLSTLNDLTGLAANDVLLVGSVQLASMSVIDSLLPDVPGQVLLRNQLNT